MGRYFVDGRQAIRHRGVEVAHPREEHLLPLMVIAGAAGADRGTIGYQGGLMGTRISAYHFG